MTGDGDRYADTSAVQVRYPLTRQQQDSDRDAWPGCPAQCWSGAAPASGGSGRAAAEAARFNSMAPREPLDKQ